MNVNNQIKKILFSHYDVEVLEVLPTAKGIINRSFFVQTFDKKYVVRLYSLEKKKSKKDIQFEVRVMNLLRKRKFPVPEIIKNKKGEYPTQVIFNRNKHFCIVMEFIAGKMLHRKDIYMAKSLGILQARLHMFMQKEIKSRTTIAKVLEKSSTYSKDETAKMSPVLRKYGLEHEYMERFQQAKDAITAIRPLVGQLPRAECHSDFFGGNILIKKKKIVGILDFDNMSLHPLIFEIANTLRAWLFHADPRDYKTIVQNYIFGYQKVRKLSTLELRVLPAYVTIRSFAVTNYLTTRKLYKRLNEKEERIIRRTLRFDKEWGKFIKRVLIMK